MPSDIVTQATRIKRPFPLVATLALAVALVALFLSMAKVSPNGEPTNGSTIAVINKSKILRVGYEGYPPYVVKDPATGKLSGFSVDLAEMIAGETGWKVQWIQTSPDTKIPDLQVGKFDVMTEPIFRTIPRATQVSFSRAYMFFGDAAAIVRKGEQRFQTIDDLNSPNVTVVVRQGYTDQTFATNNLPKATLKVLKVDDVSQLFLEVISGKADVALSDLAQVRAFASVHVKDVEARFVDPAPSYIPAGLMLRQGDFAFYNFLNSALDYLEANGDLARLNRKYGLSPEVPPTKR